jgi:hypothetical protein
MRLQSNRNNPSLLLIMLTFSHLPLTHPSTSHSILHTHTLSSNSGIGSGSGSGSSNSGTSTSTALAPAPAPAPAPATATAPARIKDPQQIINKLVHEAVAYSGLFQNTDDPSGQQQQIRERERFKQKAVDGLQDIIMVSRQSKVDIFSSNPSFLSSSAGGAYSSLSSSSSAPRVIKESINFSTLGPVIANSEAQLEEFVGMIEHAFTLCPQWAARVTTVIAQLALEYTQEKDLSLRSPSSSSPSLKIMSTSQLQKLTYKLIVDTPRSITGLPSPLHMQFQFHKAYLMVLVAAFPSTDGEGPQRHFVSSALNTKYNFSDFKKSASNLFSGAGRGPEGHDYAYIHSTILPSDVVKVATQSTAGKLLQKCYFFLSSYSFCFCFCFCFYRRGADAFRCIPIALH